MKRISKKKELMDRLIKEDVLKALLSLTILPLVKVCREGIAAGDFLDADPYAMAGLIFGTVIGAMQSLPFRDVPVQNMDALKQDILCLLDRLVIKENQRCQ